MPYLRRRLIPASVLAVRMGTNQNHEKLLLDGDLFSFVADHLLILSVTRVSDRLISPLDTRQMLAEGLWFYDALWEREQPTSGLSGGSSVNIFLAQNLQETPY